MGLRRAVFPLDRLVVVGRLEDFHDSREPPLTIGNRVFLNSGSPPMMVVDICGDNVVTAFRGRDGKIVEYEFPAICVHRCRD